jgi:2-oxoglutarate ferredoxin oxidoreductase subunit delta
MGKSQTVKSPLEAKNEEKDTAKDSTAAKRKARGKVFIDEDRCKGCGLCIEFCPSNVLEFAERFNKKGYHPPRAANPEACTGCDLCGLYCPDFAIHGVRIVQKPKTEKAKEK